MISKLFNVIKFCEWEIWKVTLSSKIQVSQTVLKLVNIRKRNFNTCLLNKNRQQWHKHQKTFTIFWRKFRFSRKYPPKSFFTTLKISKAFFQYPPLLLVSFRITANSLEKITLKNSSSSSSVSSVGCFGATNEATRGNWCMLAIRKSLKNKISSSRPNCPNKRLELWGLVSGTDPTNIHL